MKKIKKFHKLYLPIFIKLLYYIKLYGLLFVTILHVQMLWLCIMYYLITK